MLRKPLIVLTGLLGVGLFVWGNWINFKAVASGFLLERAWQESLDTGYPVTPWSSMDARLFGRLTVPDHEIDQIVLDRSTGQTLAFAPTFVQDSDWPGDGGTTAIAAHKNTHFEFLKALKPGDAIYLQTVSGETFEYKMVEGIIIDTRVEDLIIAEDADQLVLITCYPFDALSFNGPLRYVVRARAISSKNS